MFDAEFGAFLTQVPGMTVHSSHTLNIKRGKVERRCVI